MIFDPIYELKKRLGSDRICLDYMNIGLEAVANTRTQNLLLPKITNLADLSQYTEQEISKYKNLGTKSLLYLIENVTAAGGWLKPSNDQDFPDDTTLLKNIKRGNYFLKTKLEEEKYKFFPETVFSFMQLKPFLFDEETEKRLMERLSGDVQVIAQGFAENAETVFPDQNESMQMIPAHQVIFTDDIVKELVQKGYKVGVQLVIENPQSKTQKNPNIL